VVAELASIADAGEAWRGPGRPITPATGAPRRPDAANQPDHRSGELQTAKMSFTLLRISDYRVLLFDRRQCLFS